MMLKPYMGDLLNKIDNRYLLVNVAAKRARIIAEELEEQGGSETSKPVRMALEEIDGGLIRVLPDVPPASDELAETEK